ncbi:hypothetical protein [Dactylosporangium sp. NPDC049140]|uniref:hypothetical protein n=1 Tax=Dactylosporangium sp. NPDC049140 TaxID=3155647 RepID=UPI0033D97FE0
MKWRLLLSTATAVATAALPATARPASALPTAGAPAGLHRFVVAIGEVSASERTNWVRLGTYEFDDTGQVSEAHWHWTQRERVTRSSTGVSASGCVARNCTVRTANGFQSAGAPNTLHGTYTATGSLLRVTWDGTTGWEEWTISQPAPGKLAKLSFVDNSFGATVGFGYGSNAAWTTRASTQQLSMVDTSRLIHDYYLWKTDNGTPYVDHGDGSPFWNRDWTPCAGGRCLGGVTSGTQYYLSRPNTTATDRRDTIWHWRTVLADARGETCYTGNSHVKPMLEIVDSDGVFHGWVGVEASINQSVPAQGTSADDIGVFTIADA